MIGNTLYDFVTIRLSITFLRLIAPLSILYLVCCATFPVLYSSPIALYAALEASFYLLVYLPRRARLQAPPTHPPPVLTREQREKLFQRCLKISKADSVVDLPYPSGWFLPKNSKPKREDVVDWLLWALFSASKDFEGIGEYDEEIGVYVQQIEAALGYTFESGHSRDEGIVSMRVNLDPVVMLHRPLLWYFIVAAVDAYTSIMLSSLGFRHCTPRDSQWSRTFPPRPVLYLLSSSTPEHVAFPYWYRPHTAKSKKPLVFFHGIGIGLFPYIPFLSVLTKSESDVGILLPELMPISMHMTSRSVPPRHLLLASLELVLRSLDKEESPQDESSETQPLLSEQHTQYDTASPSCTGWKHVVLAGHSYGTFVCGWILRQLVDIDTAQTPIDTSVATSLSHRISDIILVDPIPILLSNPTVAHNFLYREPSTVCPRRLGSHSNLLDEESGTDTPSKSPYTLSSYYSSAAAWQLWFFASRDADIARTLFRTFFWTEGGIWKEEIAALLAGQSERRNISVFLGGMDQVVPAEGIRKYLTGEERWSERWVGRASQVSGEFDLVREEDSGPSNNGSESGCLEVYLNPKLDHAVIFDDERWTVPLVKVARRYTHVCT